MKYNKNYNPEVYHKGQFFSDPNTKKKYYFRGDFFGSRYGNLMHDDMPHQYRNRPRTAYLLDALGRQMDELRQFLFDVMIHRSIETAVGIQLDHIGSIVCLTRDEAKVMFNWMYEEPTEEHITSYIEKFGGTKKDAIQAFKDGIYRKAIKYKIYLNYSNSTYSDVFEYLRLYFSDFYSETRREDYGEKDILGFKFTEEPDIPAAIIVEGGDGVSEDLPTEEEINTMIDTKFPRAAGIGIKYRIHQPFNNNSYLKFGEPKNTIDIESSVEPFGYDNKYGLYKGENEDGDYFEFLTDELGNILIDEDEDLLVFDHKGPSVDFYATENKDIVTNGNENVFVSSVKQVEI